MMDSLDAEAIQRHQRSPVTLACHLQGAQATYASAQRYDGWTRTHSTAGDVRVLTSSVFELELGHLRCNWENNPDWQTRLCQVAERPELFQREGGEEMRHHLSPSLTPRCLVSPDGPMFRKPAGIAYQLTTAMKPAAPAQLH